LDHALSIDGHDHILGPVGLIIGAAALVQAPLGLDHNIGHLTSMNPEKNERLDIATT
jgi:hypothetical protein